MIISSRAIVACLRANCAFLSLLLLVLPTQGQRPKPAAPQANPFQAARERWLKGNYEEALAAYESLIAQPDTKLRATLGKAIVMHTQGQLAEAIELLQQQASDQPDHTATRAQLAAYLHEAGKWDEAEEQANAAVKQDKNQLLALWTLAQIQSDRGNIEEADKLTRSIVRYYTARSNADNDITDPDELLVVAAAGAENARRNNLSKQFSFILNEVLADALKAEPVFWPAEVMAGDMLLEKYNRPSAIDAYEKALTINPKCAPALLGKARAALTRYDMQSVDSLANQVLKLQPNSIEARHFLATVALVAGDFKQAEAKLLEAKAVNPRRSETLGRLAGIYLIKRQTQQLDAITAEATRYDSKPAYFYTALAETLEKNKRLKDAEEFYKKATALRPNVATAYNNLGLLQLRLGNTEEGRTILAEALKADPFNVRTANMLKVLKHLDGYATIETDHYILRFDRNNDRILAEFLAEYVEEIHSELKAEYGYEPPTKTLIEVYNNHDMFSGRTTGLPDLHTVGAVTGRLLTMASPSAKGVRRPFHWGRVIRHELTHVFNLAQTNFNCPHWLTEGLAVGNERMARPNSWTAILRDRYKTDTLFDLDTVLFGFVTPKSGDEFALAYCQSRLYVEYLIQTHGKESIVQLLNAYQQGLATSEAIRTATGVDQATFEQGYREYIATVLKPYLQATTPQEPKRKPIVAKTFDELRTAYEENPEDDDLAATYAEALFRRDKPKEAKQISDEVLTRNPKHVQAMMVRARLLMRAGEAEAAKGALERLREANPNDARLLLMLARLYLDSKEFDDAAEVLEQGRKTAPLDGDWLAQLAQIYRATADQARLTNVLEELVQYDPDELTGRIELAKVYFELKNYAQAEFYAKEALFIDVNHETARELLLDALFSQGKHAEVKKLEKRYAID